MIKKGDFIEFDYTAKMTENNVVFDTTVEQIAKDNKIHNTHVQYKPLVVKVGERQVLLGLDDFIVGKAPGNYAVPLSAELAFGKKNAKLLRLVQLKEFHKHQIRPFPGLDVDLDGHRGTVRAVNGGRVMVDFNHPLSGMDVTYDISIKGIVTDPVLKVKSALNAFKIPAESVEVKEGIVHVGFKAKLPEEIAKPVKEELEKMTSEKIEFK